MRYSLDPPGDGFGTRAGGNTGLNMAAPNGSGSLRSRLRLERAVDVSLDVWLAIAVGWVVSPLDGDLVDPEETELDEEYAGDLR